MAELTIKIPDGLHEDTADLVARFATALAEKLHAAEKKYGYSNFWKEPNWEGDCVYALAEHLWKGDPRDVANYCAFMWHHKWSTQEAVFLCAHKVTEIHRLPAFTKTPNGPHEGREPACRRSVQRRRRDLDRGVRGHAPRKGLTCLTCWKWKSTPRGTSWPTSGKETARTVTRTAGATGSPDLKRGAEAEI